MRCGRETPQRISNNWGNHRASYQSDLTPLAQRGSSNSGTPVSSRYGLFFAVSLGTTRRQACAHDTAQRNCISEEEDTGKACLQPPEAAGTQHLPARPT